MAAPKGNKYAAQWTLENALPRFEDALVFAETDNDCLCLQDAKFKTGIPSRSFDYLVDNHEVLRSIKQDIMNHIISRVNRLAIKDQAPAAPSIWRMKQLGERDEQTVNNNITGKQDITVSDSETAKALEEMRRKFDEEEL